MTTRPIVNVTVSQGQKEVAASIVVGIDDRALDAHRSMWQPLLAGEEDAVWDWRNFVEREHRDNCEHFTLWVGNSCEGLAIVSRQKPMRSESAVALQGCYIERLCTAPWNRMSVRNRSMCEQPRVKPVGKWLLWRAACLSMELGHLGRMGWHSLEGARDDYRRVFPTLFDLGPDDDEDGLPWFEVDETTSRRLLFDKELVRDMNIHKMLDFSLTTGDLGA